MTDRRRYVRSETAVSAGINASFSLLFVLLVFGVSGDVPVWGFGNFVFDFLPQSFAIGLMATLVPALLTRKAIAAGRVDGSFHGARPGSVVRLALRNALLAAVTGTTVWAAAFFILGTEAIAFPAALSVKIGYGALLGAIVTRTLLTSMLPAARPKSA